MYIGPLFIFHTQTDSFREISKSFYIGQLLSTQQLSILFIPILLFVSYLLHEWNKTSYGHLSVSASQFKDIILKFIIFICLKTQINENSITNNNNSNGHVELLIIVVTSIREQ